MDESYLFVFLKEEETGEITFYLKGADSVMQSIVQYNDWLEEEVSGCGLSVDIDTVNQSPLNLLVLKTCVSILAIATNINVLCHSDACYRFRSDYSYSLVPTSAGGPPYSLPPLFFLSRTEKTVMVRIKDPLLLVRKCSPCSDDSRFHLSLSEWSFIICPMPYNRNRFL